MATTKKETPEKVSKAEVLSYKNFEHLKKYMDERAKIVPASKSGLTSKQQRRVTREIKRARHLGLLPLTQGLR